ncbi:MULTISPECIES: replication-associated recombination protein A [unclassified Thalassolituus]|jgi:putative ATPase|uniref:replication-associated recombination protein A n=1 Tax=unclassified Thalassolituus TaxID=2624967 RepID=UPI000C0D2B28|nr:MULTISPECIES: replication-associated recombination protein A [unclassified Thalassolituus]MBN58443.1 recombination factor protein RarA [Oceanospirillaceae bacterium]MDQ4426679.1 replication-associated recombination protein A [Thalassolituus sp.]|tara:strand:- start:2314 stop:3633 length:1320 start_codon:yes stop_codon:yes gene_type:complete
MAADLFSQSKPYEPLASRLRPESLDEYIGQEHVVGDGAPLRNALNAGQIHSLILWGPPGVGKTTLARLIASYVDAQFLSLSAVMAGIKEIRASVDQARQAAASGRKSLLFIDEVHRFNKSQQDAFLPYVEDGTFIFVGATTENPSFELNNALLSRAQVYILKSLTDSDLIRVIRRGLESEGVDQGDELPVSVLASAADGDARRALNLLEQALQLNGGSPLSEDDVRAVMVSSLRRFDKGGDAFYEQISALHKSVRGSDPDASLYWFCRMLDGGCDPLYVARRLVRMASEDVGNADPRALSVCTAAWEAQERLGSPEGELNLAQAVVYLACAPKSNAVYTAYKAARKLVQSSPGYEVPLHLRNAPTQMMSDMDYGAEYRYAHDEPDAFAAGENYFPEALANERFYTPVARGLEQKIGAKLDHLRELNRHSSKKRYKNDGT